MAVPPRTRGPVPPRGAYGRPPVGRGGSPQRPHARSRSHAPSHAALPQRILILVLVVATVGAGAWWFLLRSDAAPVTGNFARQEQRFAVAARAVPESAGQVTSVTGLRRWNKEVQVHLDEMDLAYAEMVQIQNLSVDEAARIIGEAVPTAAEVIDLTGDYRDQFNEGALTTAASAADAIEALLTKLDARARAWKKL